MYLALLNYMYIYIYIYIYFFFLISSLTFFLFASFMDSIITEKKLYIDFEAYSNVFAKWPRNFFRKSITNYNEKVEIIYDKCHNCGIK